MIIDFRNAKIQLRTTIILNNITLQIGHGEALGIIGANSSGKTLLAKAVAGLIPVIGHVENTILPSDVVFVSFQSEFTLKHGISTYRQQRWNMPDSEVFPTVWEQIKVIHNQVELSALIDKFCFQDRLHRLVISLSNGEQRKLELIKALAQKPRLLVIDNAFNGLDTSSRALLSTMIEQLVKNGQSLVLTGLKTDDFPPSINQFVLVQNKTATSITRNQLSNFYPNLRDDDEIFLPQWENSIYEHLISVRDLQLEMNGKSILKSINWTVKPGEKWVLSGGNGSGKTSLLNMIFADNPKAYNCDISLFGKPKGSGESIWDIKDKIGFVSPEMHQYLPARQKVNDVLCSGFFGSEGLYRKPTTFQRNLAQRWLQTVGLKNFSDEPFGTLSASVQRIVLILRTLVKTPPLLLLDEPFQGLDQVNIQKMKNLLNTIARQTSCAIIFVSHFENEIPDAFDMEIRLLNGEVTFYGLRN
jgi:molybdate transport system ATP-binding protein